MRVTTAAVLAAVACVWFQISYFAYADGVRIETRHLDLSSPEAAARLYARIERSARLLCQDDSSPSDGTRIHTLRRCVSTAIEDAVQQARSPQLTAYHFSKNQHGDLAGLTQP